jgi:hypothetical protein
VPRHGRGVGGEEPKRPQPPPPFKRRSERPAPEKPSGTLMKSPLKRGCCTSMKTDWARVICFLFPRKRGKKREPPGRLKVPYLHIQINRIGMYKRGQGTGGLLPSLPLSLSSLFQSLSLTQFRRSRQAGMQARWHAPWYVYACMYTHCDRTGARAWRPHRSRPALLLRGCCC